MAKTIRSPETATSNWTSRAGAASTFYVSQVQASTWKDAAGSAAAETNYATGVQAAVAAKSRQAGVQASSDDSWKSGVTSVGQTRFTQGVTASAPRMSAAMGKLIPAIDTLRKSLPARGVRGSQANVTRATNFMTGLSKQRGTFKAKGVARSGS